MKYLIITHLIQNLLKHINRTSRSQQVQWLSWEQGKQNSWQQAGNKTFNGGNPLFCGFPKQATKSNDGRQAGKVEKQEWWNALWVQTIFKIRQIMWGLSLDVINKTAKQAACAHQTRSLAVTTIIINDVIFMDLKFSFFLIRTTWRLYVVLVVPVSKIIWFLFVLN